MFNKSLIKNFAAICVSLCSTAAVCSDQQLVFLFENYPPRYFIEDGTVKGTYADKVRSLMSDVGLDFKFVLSNHNRIKRALESSSDPICVGGKKFIESYFENSVNVGEFTHNPSLKLVFRQVEQSNFSKIDTYEELFAASHLIGAFIQNASYSQPLQSFVHDYRSNLLFISGDDDQIVNLVTSGRVDYTFLTDNQVRHYFNQPSSEEMVAKPLLSSREGDDDWNQLVCTKNVNKKHLTLIERSLKKHNSDYRR